MSQVTLTSTFSSLEEIQKEALHIAKTAKVLVYYNYEYINSWVQPSDSFQTVSLRYNTFSDNIDENSGLKRKYGTINNFKLLIPNYK